jgi:coproporphyrinogen III oxidase-like Fe-S oxidoreductase
MLRRTAIGLDRADFSRRTGFAIDDLAGAAIERNRVSGYLDDTGACLRLSREGVFVADQVMAAFL